MQHVSVIICAYSDERWNDLVASIDSVRRQTLAPAEIILVIDHNRVLYERARKSFADVRVCENAGARGVSGARNTGIALAMGQLIAFLDDDAVGAPDWLERLSAPFGDARVLGTGGLLEPAWVDQRPAWFPEEYLWVVGCSYRGLPTRRAPVRNPIGGSFCMRREVFEKLGGFQTEMGRVGSVPLGCEETELSIRARRHWRDGCFVFEPDAKVHHKVPPARARWSYFQARCFAEGISKASLTARLGATDGLSAERTYVLRTLPSGVLRGLAHGVITRDVSGFQRAGAIIAGLALTATGYVVGRARARTSGA
jgi:glucosyl-dolichyl phosphate glucuronosyltransferase